MFKRIFEEFDDNGDGVLSKREMVRFAKKIMNFKPSEDDEIIDTINEIWKDFDTDRSGKLNRRETLKFLNALLKFRGQVPTT
jgi:Ca2+-binding EF-hand superfamily protein